MSRKNSSKYSRIGIPITELVGSLRFAVSSKRSVDLESLCVASFFLIQVGWRQKNGCWDCFIPSHVIEASF